MGLFWQFLQIDGGPKVRTTRSVNNAVEQIAAQGGEVKDFKFQTASLTSHSAALYVGIVYEAPAPIDLGM